MRQLTEKLMGSVALLSENGLSVPKIAETLDLSESTVYTAVSVFNSARSRTPVVPSYRDRKALIAWSSKHYNVPEELLTQVVPAEEPEEEQEEPVVKAICDVLSEKLDEILKAINAIDNRLSAMQMTAQGIRSESDTQTKKIVETININGDILTKEWQGVRDRLEAIKMNTRRRREE